MARRPRAIRFRPLAILLEDRLTPATHVYTNLGSTFNWSEAANWSGGVPTSNESGGTIVEFGNGITSVMNISGLVVDEIRFLAGGNTIRLDNRLRLRTSVRTTNISNPSGNNSITTTVPSTLEFQSSNLAFIDVGSAAKLTITTPVEDGGGGFKKLGTGTLEFSGSNGDSITGQSFITDGTVRLARVTPNSLIDRVLSETIRIGDGTGAAGSAVLSIVESFQLPQAAAVTIESDGRLELHAFDDFKTLSLNGGRVLLDNELRFQTTGSSINVTADSEITETGSNNPMMRFDSSQLPVVVADGVTLRITTDVIAHDSNDRLVKDGQGTIEFGPQSGATNTDIPISLAVGRMLVSGTTLKSDVTVGGGVLVGGISSFGEGIGDLTLNAGTLDLNQTLAAAGSFYFTTNDVTLAGGSYLAGVATGTSGGVVHGLRVTGNVSISGTTLVPIFGGTTPPPAGQTYKIIDNDGTDIVTGFFANVAEGGTVSTTNGTTFSVSYHGGDGNDVVLTAVPPVSPPPPPPVSPSTIAREFGIGIGTGGGSVKLLNPDQSERFTATPFGADFAGGVRTAAADFNQDGIADLVVATGPGGPSHLRILDGKTQAELFTLDPFEASFTGGVYVAAGDVTGDGVADLVITPDEGGGPRCRVFSGAGFGQIADFFGIDDPNFRGGARAALGDLNGDGAADLVVAAGFGGGPRVAAFSGKSLGSSAPVKLFGDFLAFEPELRNGTFVAAGDVDGDSKAELIAGGGPGGGPRVSVFDGTNLLTNVLTRDADFFAGDINNRGGVRVAVKNLDGDSKADLIAGAGTGAGSRVTAYAGKSLTGGAPPELFALDAFPGFAGGVFVG